MSALRRRLGVLAPLALIAYVPLLLTAPGKVAADTKTYLYLDPSRLLSRAWSMWDPNVGLGTVTHQTIGYLWPMGPWFWFWELVGMPDWIAQRLWVGTLMFAAGAGVAYLLRTLGIRSVPSVLAAALLYELSPYVLHYAARISVILLPWAALPFLVALVQRSLETRSWRHPALFALVVATAGGVNATALVLAGLGPLVWLVFAVLVHREVTWRVALGVTARIGSLTLLTSLWWIAGLWVQGGWGIDILRYTETVETVARTSLSSEVLRGLGYWFFYGGDKLGAWIEPGQSYTQHLWLIAVGFAVPVLGFCAVAVMRWRYRAAALLLVVLGTAIAVGAYPYDSPSPAGGAFKALATSSTVGLALRSTPRAVPLVALGLALLIGAALAARKMTAIAVVVGAIAILGLPPLWTGDFIGKNLQRDEDIPDYWLDAAAHLDAEDHDTRVWEIPGTDFASYRWGNTVDPITPGLMDRPYVARELIPYGTPAAADLLIAADRRLQEMVFDPDSLAPIARLLGVGDVVLRSDLQYERYRTPRPLTLWNDLTPAPSGLSKPEGFGPPSANAAIPELPLRDEVFLSTPADVPDPSPVEDFPVDDPMPIVRARSADEPVIIAGDGEGLVEAAGVGLLGGSGVVLTSAALDHDARMTAMNAGASLVLTDTNRERGRRWSTLRDNAGYTESPGETPLRTDPSDNRLPLYPDAPDSAYTTVEQRGVQAVRATAYGNPVSFTPEDRPAFAFDGDVTTHWQVGALDAVGGERWRLDTSEPVTSSSIDVVQPRTPFANRWITKLEVRLDGESVGTFDLGDPSHTPEGQTIDLGDEHTFSTLELVVQADNIGKLAKYDGYSGVGLAEVRIGGHPDLHLDEVVHLPTDLLAGGSKGHPLSIVLARLRSNPIEPTSGDEERSMARVFTLPEARSFSVSGEARVSAALPDDRIDNVLNSLPSAITSSRLGGDLTSRGSSALDGDPTTAWTTSFGQQRGQWIETRLTGATDQLGLRVLADGQHSVPTRLHVTTDAGDDVTVDVPAIIDQPERGHVESVRIDLPAELHGDVVRVEVADVREVQTTDWYSKQLITMPIGIAELGIDAGKSTHLGVTADCRDDLLTIDGKPVDVRVLDADDAAVRHPLDVGLCDGDLRLAAGEHELRTALGAESGFDIDRLVLSSDARGRAARMPKAGAEPTVDGDATVKVVQSSHASMTVEVDGTKPFWLVLGQSHSKGWTASDGLGEPTLVDGYANGWYVEPRGDGPQRITLTFAPQKTVTLLEVLSLLGAVLCVGLIAVSWRRRDAALVGDAPEPAWHVPWAPVGVRPSSALIALVAIVGGLLSGALVDPLVGLGVAVALVVGMLLRRGPFVVALAAVGSLGLGALFTIARQQHNRYPADFGWPSFFRPAHLLAWIGLLLISASLVAAAVRRRAAPRDPTS